MSLLAAPRDILRIKPGPLLRVTASLMALRGDALIAIAASGNCIGVGEYMCGGLRPLNPSGEDCKDSFVGLVVEEGFLALIVLPDARVTGNGTEVMR